MSETAQCETCQHLHILSGDWVDYGSTRVQLPEDWECNFEWPEPYDSDGDIIEELFSAKRHDCPHFLELPRCPKHPEELMDARYGCGKCEQEMMNQMDKAAEERMERD